MGSFSWTRADMTTKRSNFSMGDGIKILVPECFGGGYIKDKYYDYGYVNKSNKAVYVDKNGNKYKLEDEADLYGILAIWNRDKFVGNMKYILECVKTCQQEIRLEGIDIGCYAWQINNCKYPLKLVSCSYKGTYEDCDMVSYSDPHQGFSKKNWENRTYDGDYFDYYEKQKNQKEKSNRG